MPVCLNKNQLEYIVNYFRSIYAVPAEIQLGYGTEHLPVNVFASASNVFRNHKLLDEQTIVWTKWRDKKIPVLFPAASHLPLLETTGERIFIRHDLFAGAFYFLSGWQEYVYMQRHSAIRYPFTESLQHRLNIIRLPVVNYYFDVLKTAIEQAYSLKLAVQPTAGRLYDICLTHDIDEATTGWKADLAATLKKKQLGQSWHIFREKIRGNDTCFNLYEINDLEANYSAKSSYYFIARSNTVFAKTVDEKGFASDETSKKTYDPGYFFKPKRSGEYRQLLQNADYDLRMTKIRQIFQILRQAGSEIGIHGSFGSSISEPQFAEDFSRFDAPVSGGRFHYLCFDITKTFDILENAGIQYDSTLGFAELPGFRNGCCFPFQPYNIREDRPYQLIEIPLIAMDATYRSYMKLPLSDVLADIRQLRDTVRDFGGCLTVLWHNNYFTPYKFAGWRELYEDILQMGKSDGAEMTTGAAIAKNWRQIINFKQDSQIIKT